MKNKYWLLIAAAAVLIGCVNAPAEIAAPAQSQSIQAASQDEPVLIVFSATWCEPCQRMAPAVAQLEADGYKVVHYDYDANRNERVQWNIHSVPTMILTQGGREVSREIGEKPLDRLRAMFQNCGIFGSKSGGSCGPAGCGPSGCPAPNPTGSQGRSFLPGLGRGSNSFKDPSGSGNFTPIDMACNPACVIGDASGFLISKGTTWGVIWTCAHGNTPQNDTATFPASGQTLAAELIAADRSTDVALYKTAGRPNVPCMAVAIAPLKPGDVVVYGGFGTDRKWQAFRGQYLGDVTSRSTNAGAMVGGNRWKGSSRSGDSGGPAWGPNGAVFSLVTGTGNGETVGPTVEQLCQLVDAQNRFVLPWNADLAEDEAREAAEIQRERARAEQERLRLQQMQIQQQQAQPEPIPAPLPSVQPAEPAFSPLLGFLLVAGCVLVGFIVYFAMNKEQ